jgi:hypothetical protein
VEYASDSEDADAKNGTGDSSFVGDSATWRLGNERSSAMFFSITSTLSRSQAKSRRMKNSAHDLPYPLI